MLKTAEEAIAWIHQRKKFGVRPGLKRMDYLLEQLNHPERDFDSIHVAGTNGKGSTVSYLRALLETVGVDVGTFTSPYIECFNERIQYNQQFIADEAILSYVNRLLPIITEMDQREDVQGITEFELLTAMAFMYFAEMKVDVALIEVGLGGLYDSTNVIDPLISVITTIGLDHVDILGDTLEEIAAQKAGIIKPKRPVVTGNISPEALAVIQQMAKKNQAPLYSYQTDYQIDYLRPDKEWGEVFTFQSQEAVFESLHIPLIGTHQTENAGVALQTFILYCQLKGIPVKQKLVQQGLKKTYWPARMERVTKEPLIVLDGAHNVHAVTRLVENLENEFAGKTIHVLFSALKTKDVEGMLEKLLTVKELDILVTTFEFPKAIPLTKEIQAIDPDRISFVSLWQLGLAELLERMTNDDVLLVTGSLYFVSQVRALFHTLEEE